mmetsp:Transcript_20770/g.24002  ORF Transcript_20770/g.24002 Transcript_20770/m.24002 type:complete len:514 (-) Transcript_20770:126-1667(-)
MPEVPSQRSSSILSEECRVDTELEDLSSAVTPGGSFEMTDRVFPMSAINGNAPPIQSEGGETPQGDDNSPSHPVSGTTSTRRILRDLIVELMTSVHLPNLLQGISVGMRSSLIPIFGDAFGASDAVIGFMTAMAGVGRASTGVPAGKLTARYGFTNVMIAGMLVNVVGAVIAAGALNWFMLGVANLIFGLGIGLFFTSRHVMLACVVDKSKRGRLMSIIGGGERWSSVIGPTLGGLVIQYVGCRACAAAVIPIVLLCVGCIVKSNRVRFLDEKYLTEQRIRRDLEIQEGVNPRSRSISAVFLEHWKLITSVGFYAMNILQLRACRKLMLPLAALRAGLDATTVGLVLSSSFAVDASLFFLGGMVMDKFGRKFAAIPTTTNLGIAFLLLSLSNSTASLFMVAVFFGIADSLGAGLLLTMNADHAPKRVAAEFMGLMRVIQDAGQLVGPLIAGWVSNVVSFQAACVFFGVLGLLNAVWAVIFLPTEAKGDMHELGIPSPAVQVVSQTQEKEDSRS